jgi:hypothetical protein
LQHHDNDAKCANHVDADAAADDAVIIPLHPKFPRGHSSEIRRRQLQRHVPAHIVTSQLGVERRVAEHRGNSRCAGRCRVGYAALYERHM